MKRVASILVLVFAFTLTAQAQKKTKEKRPQLTVEQRTDLAIKKMTLALDLTEKQQKEIQPVLKAQATERMEAMKKHKEMKEKNVKPTADEIYAMKAKQLDDKIAMKNKMKTILTKEQFEKFEKMAKANKNRKKMMHSKRVMKNQERIHNNGEH